jgi:hypothetical protein
MIHHSYEPPGGLCFVRGSLVVGLVLAIGCGGDDDGSVSRDAAPADAPPLTRRDAGDDFLDPNDAPSIAPELLALTYVGGSGDRLRGVLGSPVLAG